MGTPRLMYALFQALWLPAASGAGMLPLDRRCVQEVERLHAFFETWWNGKVPQTHAYFEEHFLSAQHSAFTFVSPFGLSLNLNSTAQYIYQAHGMRYTDDWAKASQVNGADMRFLLSNISVTWSDASRQMCAVTFQEHQQVGGLHGPVQTKSNVCLLMSKEGAPNKLGWLMEHETWWPGFVHQDSCTQLVARVQAPSLIPACFNCSHCLPGTCASCLRHSKLTKKPISTSFL